MYIYIHLYKYIYIHVVENAVAHDCKRYLCFSIYCAIVQNYIFFPQFPNITLSLSFYSAQRPREHVRTESTSNCMLPSDGLLDEMQTPIDSFRSEHR